jgi:tetratricopeptide (TPR) repeat protein
MTNFETEFDRHYNDAVGLLERTGSPKDVHSFILSIADPEYRNSTLSKVAKLLAERRQVDDALQYCQSVDTPLQSAHALLDVWTVLEKLRHPDLSRQLLPKIAEVAELVNPPYERANVLLEMTSPLERSGQKEQALSLLRRAVRLAQPEPQDFEASKTLRACARTLAFWDLLPEAIEVAGAIDSRWSGLREETLDEVQGRGRWAIKSPP